MKRYGLLGALVGFVVAVLVFTQIPAVAQQTNAEAAWDVIVSPFGQQSYVIVKHNSLTGQTLILDCARSCSDNNVWWELAVEVIE